MALKDEHRTVIYSEWAPQLGKEVTEAVLSHFPLRDEDSPATKGFVQEQIASVRVEIAGLRSEMTSEIAGLRSEMTSEIAGLRSEMTSEIAGLRSEMTGENAGLRGEIGDLRVEIAGLRSEMAALRAELHAELHSMARWIAGSIVTSAGLAIGVALAAG